MMTPKRKYSSSSSSSQLLISAFQVLNEVVLQVFPNYKQIVDEVHVRIAGLPIEDKLRDLRQSHLNALIRVYGVVTRRTVRRAQPQLLSCPFFASHHRLHISMLSAITLQGFFPQ